MSGVPGFGKDGVRGGGEIGRKGEKGLWGVRCDKEKPRWKEKTW